MDGDIEGHLAESLAQTVVRINRTYLAFLRYVKRRLRDSVLKTVDQFLDPYFVKSNSQISADQNSLQAFVHDVVLFPANPDRRDKVFCPKALFTATYHEYVKALFLQKVKIGSAFWLTLARYGIMIGTSSSGSEVITRKYPRPPFKNRRITRAYLIGCDLPGKYACKDENEVRNSKDTRPFNFQIDYIPARRRHFSAMAAVNQWSYDYFLGTWDTFIDESGFGSNLGALRFKNCENEDGKFDKTIIIKFYTDARENIDRLMKGVDVEQGDEVHDKMRRLQVAVATLSDESSSSSSGNMIIED